MVRRVQRRVPLWRMPAVYAQSIQRSQFKAMQPQGFHRLKVTPVPQVQYTGVSSGPIPNGYGSAIVASGAATVQVGPMGVGTVWYPTMAVIATTSGANDGSTCALYLSPLVNGTSLAVQSMIGGQSYNGGGDTIGLTLPPVHPGTYLIAVWATAKNGDLATLTVYGTQTALVVA